MSCEAAVTSFFVANWSYTHFAPGYCVSVELLDNDVTLFDTSYFNNNCVRNNLAEGTTWS